MIIMHNRLCNTLRVKQKSLVWTGGISRYWVWPKLSCSQRSLDDIRLQATCEQPVMSELG
jgi:hypothetical protein